MTMDESLIQVGLDPRSVINQICKGKSLDESIEVCLVEGPQHYDVKYARRDLVLKYRASVQEMLNECLQKAMMLSKIEELLGKAGLDLNWMAAAICLAVQDVSVKSAAKKLGISLTYDKDKYKNAQSLMGEIEKHAKDRNKKTIALGVAKQWNMKFRNGVIHDGQPVSEKESQRILDATNDLLEELSVIVSYFSTYIRTSQQLNRLRHNCTFIKDISKLIINRF